jgi:hypothetical protein
MRGPERFGDASKLVDRSDDARQLFWEGDPCDGDVGIV